MKIKKFFQIFKFSQKGINEAEIMAKKGNYLNTMKIRKDYVIKN